MERKTKIAIVAISITVLGCIAFIVYWFAFKPREETIPNAAGRDITRVITTNVSIQGQVDAGRVVVAQRSRNDSQFGTQLRAGDTVTVAYVGSLWNTTDPKVFRAHVVGKNQQKYHVEIARNVRTDTVDYTLPGSMYTDNLTFSIERMVDSTTRVSAAVYSVEPRWIMNGPKSTTNLVAHHSSVFNMDADSTLLQHASPVFEMSTDNGENWYIPSSTKMIHYNPVRAQFTVTPNENMTGVWKFLFRCRSTDLVNKGYPAELTSQLPDYYQVQIDHDSDLSTGSVGITSLLIQDSNGGKLQSVIPSQLVTLNIATSITIPILKVFWATTEADIKNSAVYESNVIASTLPAQGDTGEVVLPSRDVVGDGVETLYIRVEDASDSGNYAYSEALQLNTPSWEFSVNESHKHESTFPSTHFHVPVHAPQVTGDEFFDSSKWNYTLKLLYADCPDPIVVSNVVDGAEPFDSYGVISINGSHWASDIYYVTFSVRTLELPWFSAQNRCATQAQDSYGNVLSFINIQVELGYQPWDGDSVTKSYEQPLQLNTGIDVASSSTQEWGSLVQFQYATGKDSFNNYYWNTFDPLGSTMFHVDGGDSGPGDFNVSVRYTDAAYITDAVIWELHYESLTNKSMPPTTLATSISVSSPNERTLELHLNSDVYDRVHLELFLSSDPKQRIISPSFILKPMFALGQHIGAVQAPIVKEQDNNRYNITVEPGTKFEIPVYGASAALIRGLKQGTLSFDVEYSQSQFVSHAEDRISGGGGGGGEWATDDEGPINTHVVFDDVNGTVKLSWTPGNNSFLDARRIRLVTIGLAPTFEDPLLALEEITSQATITAYMSDTLPFTSELALFQPVVAEQDYVHEQGRLVAGDSVVIMPKQGAVIANPIAYDKDAVDGEKWNYDVFLMGGVYGDELVSPVEESYLLMNKDATTGKPIMSIDTQVFVDASGTDHVRTDVDYYIAFQLRTDTNIVLTTAKFRFGLGFKISPVEISEESMAQVPDDYAVVLRIEATKSESGVDATSGFTVVTSHDRWIKTKTLSNGLFVATFKSKDDDSGSPFDFLVPWLSQTHDEDITITVNNPNMSRPIGPQVVTMTAIKAYTHIPTSGIPPVARPLGDGITGKIGEPMYQNPNKKWIHPIYGITWAPSMDPPSYSTSSGVSGVSSNMPSMPNVQFSGYSKRGTDYLSLLQNFVYYTPRLGNPEADTEEYVLGTIAESSWWGFSTATQWMNVHRHEPGHRWIPPSGDAGINDQEDDRLTCSVVTGDIGPHKAENIKVQTMKLTPTFLVDQTEDIYKGWYEHVRWLANVSSDAAPFVNGAIISPSSNFNNFGEAGRALTDTDQLNGTVRIPIHEKLGTCSVFYTDVVNETPYFGGNIQINY
jgi:hypothetical protein